MEGGKEMTKRIEAVGKPAGCKLLRISATVRQSADFAAEESGFAVERISIRGDFFAVPEEEFEKIESALAGTPVSRVAPRFELLASGAGIQLVGISGAGIQTLLEEALHG
jgi:hypothetical protein